MNAKTVKLIRRYAALFVNVDNPCLREPWIKRWWKKATQDQRWDYRCQMEGALIGKHARETRKFREAKNMKSLEQEWIQYRDACYPEGISKLQETETRQAFYAGCLVVLKAAVDGTQGMSDEQAYQHLIAVVNEAQTVCGERVYEMKGRN